MPVASSVRLGPDVQIPQPDLVNLYGCVVGARSRIGAFVEIQVGVTSGEKGLAVTRTLAAANRSVELNGRAIDIATLQPCKFG